MAAVLSVLNIKRNTEYETALQVTKSVKERMGLLLLMPKCFVRSLLDQLLPGSAWKVPQFGSARKLPAFGPSHSCSPRGAREGSRGQVQPQTLWLAHSWLTHPSPNR